MTIQKVSNNFIKRKYINLHYSEAEKTLIKYTQQTLHHTKINV